MFDIGWSEMAVVAVVALIVIGPRDLPKLLYTAGKLAAKARATLSEFQQGLHEMAREAELEELRKKIDAARDFNPEREISKTLDPTGEVEAALDSAILDSTQIKSAGEVAAILPPPSPEPDSVAQEPGPVQPQASLQSEGVASEPVPEPVRKPS